MSTNLTKGQAIILSAAAVPMVAVGGLGGWGTYTNIVAEFNRAATAIGVVAAGEGVTLVLALVMVGVTMLGQAAPAPVRLGLWAAPVGAGLTGVVVADDYTEAVVYGMTPLAMSAAAEGLGFLARRIVVYTTGTDMEAQRRNAATMQRLAYHRARSTNHPLKWVRKVSELTSWRLAKKAGTGDTELGARLVHVQRERLTEGADAALLDMLHIDTPSTAAETTIERIQVAADTPDEVTDTPTPQLEAAPAAPEMKPLVICGDRRVWHLQTPDVAEDDEVPAGAEDRLPAAAAANVIRAGWVLGTSPTETARQATRSVSYVKKVFARLDEEARTTEQPEPPVRLLRPAVSE